MVYNIVGASFELPENIVGLVITAILGIVASTVAALLARRGAKLGNREQRAPDVQEMWVQQENDRRVRQIVEDIWWSLRRAFQSYYTRVQRAVQRLVSSGVITEAQAKPFELTAAEQKAIDAEPESD